MPFSTETLEKEKIGIFEIALGYKHEEIMPTMRWNWGKLTMKLTSSPFVKVTNLGIKKWSRFSTCFPETTTLIISRLKIYNLRVY
jgi:hypothetical protein